MFVLVVNPLSMAATGSYEDQQEIQCEKMEMRRIIAEEHFRHRDEALDKMLADDGCKLELAQMDRVAEDASLQLAAQTFHKKSRSVGFRFQSRSSGKPSKKLSNKRKKKKKKKKSSIDEVFADMENVFNGLAAFVLHFEPQTEVSISDFCVGGSVSLQWRIFLLNVRSYVVVNRLNSIVGKVN